MEGRAPSYSSATKGSTVVWVAQSASTPSCQRSHGVKLVKSTVAPSTSSTFPSKFTIVVARIAARTAVTQAPSST
eukprot:15498829-Heterocapsa_arctica.AAC.1